MKGMKEVKITRNHKFYNSTPYFPNPRVHGAGFGIRFPLMLKVLSIAAGVLSLPLLIPVQAQHTVVILGSSTSAGTGATNYDSSYAGRYGKYLTSLNTGWKLVNLAVGGYTTYQLMPTGNKPPTGRPAPDAAHNLTKALSLHPDVIFLSLGSNDIGNNYATTETDANYDSIRTIGIRAGVRFWVSTPMPRTAQDSAGRVKILALRARVMDKYKPRAIDFYDSLGDAVGNYYPAFNSGDGIHTNDRGHKLLFNRVVAANFTTVPTVLASRPDPRIGSRPAMLWDERLGVLTAGRSGSMASPSGFAPRFDMQGRQRFKLIGE